MTSAGPGLGQAWEQFLSSSGPFRQNGSASFFSPRLLRFLSCGSYGSGCLSCGVGLVDGFLPFFDKAPELRPVFLSDNVAAAAFGAATAGMVIPGFEIKSIVEADFGAFRDIPGSDQPDDSPDDLGFAVRLAGMVDEPAIVPQDIAINVKFLVQDKDIDRTFPSFSALFQLGVAAPDGLRLGDFMSFVVEDAGAFGNIPGGEDAQIVNR